MSDKRFSATPVIVGVVIALLGIFTGLYFAENAREQLAASEGKIQPPQEAAPEEGGALETALPAVHEEHDTDDTAESLPPLEPVVIDLGAPSYAEEQPATQAETDLEAPADQTEEAAPITPYEPLDEDDFVPVTPEEEDSLA